MWFSTQAGGATEGEEIPLKRNIICPVFEETGECKHGFKCRFLGSHFCKDETGNLVLIQDEEKIAMSAVSAKELNFMSPDTLRLLRSKKVR